MSNVHLNGAALKRVLRERSQASTRELAGRIADAVRRQNITVGDVDGGAHEIPLPVRVTADDDGTTRVALAHPAGKAVQAKHGSLTRAAASLGFEVRG